MKATTKIPFGQLEFGQPLKFHRNINLKYRILKFAMIFTVATTKVCAPVWVPRKGWSIHSKGYIIYTSRSKTSGIRRGTRLHRLVLEQILKRKLKEDEHVHHMDFDKGNNCWCNLLLLPSCFNPSYALRDPYTGQFLSTTEFERRYGGGGTLMEDMPDWVTEETV